MRYNSVRGVLPFTLPNLVLLLCTIACLASCEKVGNKFHAVLSYVPSLDDNQMVEKAKKSNDYKNWDT